MLLVLAAWDIQESAVAPASNEATLTLEEADELRYKIETSIDDADWHTENFRLAQQRAEEELAEIQARLAFAERKTQEIRDELVQLEQLAQQLDSQTSATPEEVEQLKRLLDQQQQRKEAAELELAELRKEAAQREKSYAIVPSRSADGTFRRPIYIECRDNKIIIQPEGIELVPGDFQALEEPVNPFDTVLRVIRQYYTETGQVARGSEPYPLLIVRPSGVEMYENAHMAIVKGKWVRDFGYEIVNEDWNIQYPEPSEELRNRISQHLDIARDRLSGYLVARRMAESAGMYGSDMAQQFRVDNRGDVVPIGGGFQRPPAEARPQTAGGGQQNVSPHASRGEGGVPPSAAQERGGVSPPFEMRQQMPDGRPLTAPPYVMQEDVSVSNQQTVSSFTQRVSEAIMDSMGETMAEQQMMQRPPQNLPQNPSQRAQNWGLKGATQFTTSVSRVVVIRCEADRFVLATQSGLRTERVIPITGSVSSAADQLVQVIWEFQESWGSAGTNTHWRPILQVRVTPGGERRLQELKVHLRNSGLVIEE